MSAEGLPETNRLRCAVVGAGKFGGFHAAKIAENSLTDLAFVVDRDGAAGTALASRFDAAAATDLSAVLPEVDVVFVTVPASAHAQIAAQALAAGRHVFIEKPIALSLADADGLIAQATANGVVLQVGHQERYVAAALGLLDLPEAPPLQITCHRCMPATGRGEDVSVVMDLMIHDLDLICALTGRHATEFSVEVASVAANIDLYDAVAAEFHLLHDPQAIATVTVSRRSETRRRSLMLDYETGAIELDFLTRTIQNKTPYGLKASLETDDVPALKDPLAYGLSLFLKAIEGKAPAGGVTGGQAREALALALAVEAGLSNRSDRENGSLNASGSARAMETVS